MSFNDPLNLIIKDAWESRDANHTWNDVATLINVQKGTNLTGNACRKRYSRLIEAIEAAESDDEELSYISDTYVGDEIDDDESLVNKVLSEAGLDSDAWNVHNVRIKRWGTPLKDGPDKTVIVDNWSIGLRLEPIGIGTSPEQLLEKIREIAPPPKRAPKKKRTKNLFMPAIYDAHIGKKSIGEDEDIGAVYLDCLESLINSAGDFDRTLLVIGNDLGNIDNLAGTTTAGTPQTSKFDFYESARYRCALMIRAVDRLLDHAPVDVMVVPGNHDKATSYWLGLVMDAYYHDNIDVDVYLSDMPTQWYRWGVTQFMFTHGDKFKPERLVAYMASHDPQDFAECRYHEVYMGHFHTYRKMIVDTEDNNGIMIRFMPGLSVSDRWHFDNWYTTSRRGAIGVVYSEDDGWIKEFPAWVD